MAKASKTKTCLEAGTKPKGEWAQGRVQHAGIPVLERYNPREHGRHLGLCLQSEAVDRTVRYYSLLCLAE